MCMNEVAEFKPVTLGYQVKEKISTNEYRGVYFHGVRTMGNDKFEFMIVGVKYKAIESRMRGDKYTMGFHVFHTLADAKKYLLSNHAMHLQNPRIVQVRVDGIQATGYQKFTFFTGMKHLDALKKQLNKRDLAVDDLAEAYAAEECRAKVTVARYATIVKEIKV